jgi:asparagine synthase (glutamine-hydrolysing)
MCGIVGGIGSKVQLEIKSNFDLLNRRGPDHQELVSLENGLTLGATRLSMTDPLPRSNQPMENHLSGDIVVFNGEIYNYKNLRNKLSVSGIKFSTESDTEVLLKSLTAFGSTCIQELEGMFAFAFYDKKSNCIIMARDFLGKKPLYFHLNKDYFIFSSQLNLIKKCLSKVAIDENSLTNYLVLGYTIDPLTIYKEIYAVNPGEYIIFDINLHRIIRRENFFPKSIKNFSDQNLRQKITNAIETRVNGHSNFAISLSGGLDSSIIALTAAELGLKTTAFSIRWPGSDKERYNNDFKKASNFAKKLQINFSSVDMPGPNLIPELLNGFTRAMEEPNANPTGLSMMELYSQIANEGHRLLLTGDGADEVFAGYERYIAVNKLRFLPLFKNAKLQNIMQRTLPNFYLMDKFEMTIFESKSEEFWLHWQKIIDKGRIDAMTGFSPTLMRIKLPDIAFDLIKQDKNRIANMLVRDLKIWLVMESNRKLDRVSMWHSIEARSPFLDENIIGHGFSEIKKYHFRKLNKQILMDSYPELSQFDKKYKKQGFISPLGYWLRENPDLIMDSIKYLSSNLNFDFIALKKLSSAPYLGNFKDFRFLWSLVVLANWHSNHLRDT